jgi:hypothetical protein
MSENNYDVAVLAEDELPGPGTMCFHYFKPMHRCVLKPGHTGDHWHSKFTVSDTKVIEED